MFGTFIPFFHFGDDFGCRIRRTVTLSVDPRSKAASARALFKFKIQSIIANFNWHDHVRRTLPPAPASPPAPRPPGPPWTCRPCPPPSWPCRPPPRWWPRPTGRRWPGGPGPRRRGGSGSSMYRVQKSYEKRKSHNSCSNSTNNIQHNHHHQQQ